MIEKDNIPNGWAQVTLGDVANYLNGRAFKPSEWEVSGLPILRIQNLNNVEAKCNYSTQVFEDRFKVGKGDLLFAWSASLGAYIWNGDDAWLNQHIFKVVPQRDCNKLFLYYLLKKIVAELYAKTHGSGMVHITKGKFEATQFLLPPLPEQHRIVSKIEELFSDLDKGIESLKTVQQQLKIYRLTVLKWAFEGKLTNTKFESVVTGDVIDTINNGYTPSKQFLTPDKGEIPFLKVYNLNFDGTLNSKKAPAFIPKAIHQKELKRSICYPGDVLINIVGPPLGKVSIVSKEHTEWNINQAIVLFRPNKNVLSKYIAYFMQNPVTTQWLEDTSKATAGQWNIKVSTCRVIPFQICSVADQEKIIKEIECRLSVVDKIEETILDSLKQAEALRQSILKTAFEGNLIRQNNEDEPASVLLDKIKLITLNKHSTRKNKQLQAI